MNIKLLLVEDDEDHASLIMDVAQKGFQGQVEIEWITHLKLALRKINEAKYDICLFDLSLPDSPMSETMDTLQAVNNHSPFIVLTSTDDDSIGKKMIHGGIQDYLPKNELSPKLLFRTCIYAIERQKYTVDLETKNRDQRLFCQSLSHDFRAPIRRIGASINFLREDLENSAKIGEAEERHFSVIEHNLKSINELVEALYTYLNVGEGGTSLNKVNLSDLLQECIDAIKQDYEDSIKIDMGPLPSVEGNREQLFILFKNLVGNAVKYNQREPEMKVFCHTRKTNNFCQVCIQDNGIGIDQKYIDKVFDPFQRLHTAEEYPGTGLGLSLAKRIVDNHGGKIYAESTLGVGSIFTVELPFSQR